MKIVLTLTQRHEQEAAKRVEECRELVAQEQAQLEQLESYSEQYMQTYVERSQFLSAQERMGYSGFIQRLTGAISDQQSKLARMNQVYEQALSQWRERYLKRESIANLITRLEQEDNALIEKRLQKELDELAAQQFNRRPQ